MKRSRFVGFFVSTLMTVAASAATTAGNVTIAALGRPALVFACDRPTDQLRSVITPAVVAQLRSLQAGIALSTEDLSPERAAIVHELNAAGIPMYAWIVLRHEDGYYVNAANAAQTRARIDEFDRWSREHHLRWEEVGLDIEPRLNEFVGFKDHKLAVLGSLIRRACNGSVVVKARADYTALIQHMHAMGYRVQTHQFAFIVDERAAHSTLVERLLGIVDVRGDDEVLMLYSSLSRNVGAGIVYAYGPFAQTIAVGSTALSGDPAMDARMPPLDWDEFSRDLIVAAHFSHVVGVYSLEGCIRQGFLSRLEKLDWAAPVRVPAASIDGALNFRKGVAGILWLAGHFVAVVTVLLLVFAGLIVALVKWRRRRRRRRGAAQ